MTDELVTYRYADGTLASGRYDRVGSLDWFDREGDYVEVVEERWRLVAVSVHTFGALDVWCSVCDAPVLLVAPAPPPVFCELCAPDRAVS